MAISSSAVTITTSATLIGTAHLRRSIAISVASGGQTVYIGGSNVTTANGYPIEAGSQFANSEGVKGDQLARFPLYGIVAATTQEIRILEGSS